MKKSLLIITLVLHSIYYVLAISSLGNYEYVGGVGMGFKLWIYAMLLVPVCLIAHFIQSADALLSLKSVFNIIKLILVVAGFPLCFIVGMTSGVWNSIVWNIYFLSVFILQIFSLFIRKPHNESKE